MVADVLKERMKIDIRMLGEVDRAKETGEEVHVYKSQIFELLGNGELEITMPLEKGRVILLPLGVRYEFAFYTQSGIYKSVGQVKERYKTDNRYMLRIVLNTPLSKFQRREYYRMECILDMTYFLLDEEQAQMEDVEAIMDSLRDVHFYEKQRRGTIVDISGGGIRFISEDQNEADGYVLVLMMLRGETGEKQYCLTGRILQSVRLQTAEKKYENRVQFVIRDARIREEIIRYIFMEERRARNREKD